MTEDLSGLTIKGYKLSERIGAGGFGAVYTADQSTVGRRVAVKIILPGYANQPDFIRRFESEARLVARLEHPYIVPLYDYWRDPSGAYLVMRWLRGGSLREALGERPFSLPMTAQILDQVASGLSLAHRSGVVHRDIKPSNILLDEEGNAYLSDFGIAQELKRSDNGGRGERLVGTLDYLSPEQAKDEVTGPQSDIYSLGITLYELLTGQHPYPGHSSVERLFKHINDPLPEIEELGEGMNEVLRKATAKNPGQRYADALEMAAAFRQAAILDEDGQAVSLVETLTPREQQILGLIVAGKTNRQIAQELFIELSTVKWYIRQIYSKLGVRSRVQAMVRARELRLVVPGPEDVKQAPKSTSVSVALQEAANPYKGLNAFEAADSRDFFGREALIERLISRLDSAEGQTGPRGRFLAIVGPSGSGKSSLVQAGLIPAIWRGALPGSERWFVVEMMPGARPLDELEVALTRVAANQTERLHEQLTRDENGLLRVAGLILPHDGSELVLIIDQFEELFTLVDDEDERLIFLNLLQRAVSDPRSRVRVAITLRADFYHRPLQYAEFGDLVRGQMETVLPLSAEELERAIVRPAEGAGAQFEAGLAATIIEDVRYQPGGLPLMQYALTELFDRREGRLLTRGAYEAIGGIAGALAGRAESLYQELDPEGQGTVRQLFLQLTTVEQKADDGLIQPVTRRRVTRSELQAVAGDAELMDEVIDTYAAYRLLALDHDPSTRRPTVEVAHEAILVSWDRLRSWLEESRDDLRQRRRLQRLAADWQESGQDPSFLLAGTQLDLFVNWAESTDLALTAVEKEFLAANVAAREARLAEEAARQRRELQTAQQLGEAEKRRAEEQAQAAGRLRNRAYLLAGALLIAAVLAAAALGFARSSSRNAGTAATRAAEALANQYLAATNEAQALANEARAEENAALAATREAEAAANAALAATRQVMAEEEAAQRATAEANAIQERATAEDLARLARSRELAAVSVGNVKNDPELAILLAMEALSAANTFEATNALHAALLASRLRQRIAAHNGRVRGISYNPDETLIATTTKEGSARVFAADSGDLLFETPINILSGDVALQASFSPDGSRLATLEPGEAFSLAVWNTGSWQRLETIELPITTAGMANYSVNPDWSQVAVGYEDGTAAIWDLENRQQLAELPGHSNWVEPLYSPDGSRLATFGGRDAVIVWDTAAVAPVWQLDVSDVDMPISMVALSPDGRWLAIGANFGNSVVQLWNLEEPPGEDALSPTRGMRGHKNAIYGLAFSPDSRQIASVSVDQSARIWDVLSGQELFMLGHDAILEFQVYNQNGDQLLTGDRAGNLRFWDLTAQGSSELLSAAMESDFVFESSLSPDGERLATAIWDGTARIWDVKKGRELHVLEGLGNRAMMVDFDPEGHRLATAGTEGTARVWDAGTGRELLRLEGHGEGSVGGGLFTGVLSVDYSPDGQTLATAGADGTARIWDAVTGEELLLLEGHTSGLTRAVFSPDGKLLVTGSERPDATVKIWDTVSGTELFSLPASHGSRVWGLAFSPNGRFLVTSGGDRTAKIWTLDREGGSGQLLATLTGHDNTVSGLRFSLDGRLLATASAGEETRLWDMSPLDESALGATVPTLLTVPGGSPAFNAEASELITVDREGLIRVYALDKERLMALAGSRITRGFTTEECQRFKIERCPWEPETSK